MQVLLNIVDALFICYALDRDRSAVTKTEVHEIFSLVSATASSGFHIKLPLSPC